MLRRNNYKSRGHICNISSKRCKTDQTDTNVIDTRHVKFQALQLIATSQFLDIHELGTLLLTTSKSISAALFETQDDVWETLCDCHFGKDVVTLIKFIPSNEKRSFISSLLKKDNILFDSCNESIVRPLKFSPSDYHLIINIYSKIDKKNIFSYTLGGSKVLQFFDNGILGPNKLFNCLSTY